MEISLEKLFHLVLEKIWWVVLVTIIGGLVAFSYTAALVQPTYASTIKMMVSKNEEAQSNLSDLSYAQYAQSMAKTYIAILNDKDFYRDVAKKSDLGYKDQQLANMFSFNIVDETAVLEIKVQAHSPRDTKIIADAAAQVIPQRLKGVYEQATIKQVSGAREGTKVGPSLVRNTALGALLGAVVIVLIIFLRDLLDTRIKTEEDLVERYDLPLLGLIPDFSTNTAKTRRK